MLALPMPDAVTMAIVTATFLFAGTVKGVIGLGLPTVSLAILTVAFDLPTAMVLLLVPSFVTNLWQAAVGGNGRAIVFRLWPFLVMATVSIWLGASALTRIDVAWLQALLGLLLIVYSTLDLSGYRLTISPRREVWTGPLVGAANGVLTGMTGSFVVPGVMYLQAIGLPRDMLIQAMGMLFTVSTLALALALQGNGLLDLGVGTVSLASLLPAALGMALGRRIRRFLSEQVFRRLFFAALLLLGAYIAANAIVVPG